MRTTRLRRLLESCLRKRSALRKIVFWHQEKTYHNKLFKNYVHFPLRRTVHSFSRRYVSNRAESRSEHSITWISRHLDFPNVSEWWILLRSDEGSRIRSSLIVHNFSTALSKWSVRVFTDVWFNVRQQIPSSKNWSLRLVRNLVFDS